MTGQISPSAASGLTNPLHLLLALVVLGLALALWIVPALWAARLAERQGRSFAAYLVGGLAFGWIFSLVAALVLSSRSPRA